MRRTALLMLVTFLLVAPNAAALANPDPDPLAVAGAGLCSGLAVVDNGKDTNATKQDIAQCWTRPMD